MYFTFILSDTQNATCWILNNKNVGVSPIGHMLFNEIASQRGLRVDVP